MTAFDHERYNQKRTLEALARQHPLVAQTLAHFEAAEELAAEQSEKPPRLDRFLFDLIGQLIAPQPVVAAACNNYKPVCKNHRAAEYLGRVFYELPARGPLTIAMEFTDHEGQPAAMFRAQRAARDVVIIAPLKQFADLHATPEDYAAELYALIERATG